MPVLGLVISKVLGLSPSLSAGLILLSCCPGGTASNVVRLSHCDSANRIKLNMLVFV